MEKCVTRTFQKTFRPQLSKPRVVQPLPLQNKYFPSSYFCQYEVHMIVSSSSSPETPETILKRCATLPPLSPS